MEPFVVLAGVTFVGIGAYLTVFPDRSRNWVSADEWRRSPDAAAEKQRHLATAVAGALVVVGLVVALFGAVVL